MTRDSPLFSWWVAVIGGFAGYLATGPSPRVWDWPHYMQAIVVLCGLVGAKLGTSSLKSSAEANAVNPNR